MGEPRIGNDEIVDDGRLMANWVKMRPARMRRREQVEDVQGRGPQ